MKRITLISIMAVFLFMGCATNYETIAHKDISVKVRTFWGNVDYDSRVVSPDSRWLPELDTPVEVKKSEIEPIGALD